MAQVFAPEKWQFIKEPELAPGNLTSKLFLGSEVPILNNGEACRIIQMQSTDYITDYDDRRSFGHANVAGNTQFNRDGNDGLIASAYGVFQDVMFDSKVYNMSRHRSCAFRVYDEQQYSGPIGQWATGDAIDQNGGVPGAYTTGSLVMSPSEQMSKAIRKWENEVLSVDIDKYNIYCACTGHISGRWVQDDATKDKPFDGEHGMWVSTPAVFQGEAMPPRFAPIHAVEFDDANMISFLDDIECTWNALNIPQDKRVIVLSPRYKWKMLQVLVGNGLPVTEAAYSDVKSGNFTQLYGWNFDFTIPEFMWPKIFVDANLNVVHNQNGDAIYDMIINSIEGGNDELKLQRQLMAQDRMDRNNYVRTVWDDTTKKFKKVVTNYVLGNLATGDFYEYNPTEGMLSPQEVEFDNYGKPQVYPYTAPGSGYGLPPANWQVAAGYKKATGPVGPIATRQVIGLCLYQGAVQLSQQYSNMVTQEGQILGKFSMAAYEVKYECWVLNQYAAGILPILKPINPSTETHGIPVYMVKDATVKMATGEKVTVANTAADPLFTKAINSNVANKK